ncbi:putative two-component system sensor kinase [Leucobacter sp. 7(1)]|uniref:sensor histidine kinase n=1 Tax=Leucobacter sp. 7(1) TaxID=1255613 RepID=UPI00097EA9E6|nr:sensor histidine kinase [Leucobacter sp. 7(1)]SJN08833.1 putative two-component system sensor kinase [Leucobacter sp. 7(1)]
MNESQPARTRPLRWWDLAASGVLLVLLVPGGVGLFSARSEGGDAAWEQIPALGMLAGFVVLYLVLARPAMRRVEAQEPPLGRDVVGLILIVVIAGVAAAVNPSFATVQVITYPMIWTITGYWERGTVIAVLGSAALAVVIGAGTFFSYQRLGAGNPGWTAVAVAVCSFVFAVFLGMWLTRVHTQSEAHRALAEQLRASQAEVAALSAASGAAAERERMSRELHDTLTQTLTGLVMLSEQAERALVAGDTERAQDRTARVGAAAREAVSEARALVATTQPLGDRGLHAALERVAARLRADAGLEVTCRLAPLTLPREQEVVLLRAAQEGLSNARRHAHATRVELSLTAAGLDRVELRVADNGVGPGLAATTGPVSAPDGFGLSGLTDRARALGGEVRFGPRPGGGAQLVVSLVMSGVAVEAHRTPERTSQ